MTLTSPPLPSTSCYCSRQGFLEDLRLIRDNCHTFSKTTHPNLPAVADKLLAEGERGIELSKVVCIITLCSKYASLCSKYATCCSKYATFCSEYATFCSKYAIICGKYATLCGKYATSC